MPKWFDLFLGLESGAMELSSFDTVVVPGLLQTRNYAMAAIGSDPDLSVDQVQELVEVRMGRQQILQDGQGGEGVYLHWVIDESVLYRLWGNANVIREQLEHLLRMATQPRIVIQILPFDVGANRARDGGAFTVMKFPPEMEDPGLVYLELLTGGQYFEKPEEIAQYRRALSHLHAFAASPKTSCGIIERRLKEVK